LGWNHNLHYHAWLLRQLPPSARLALDAGCGEGALTPALRQRCEIVVGLDRDEACLASASLRHPQSSFVRANAMAPPFREESFDVVAAIATLHHLPLREGLRRFADLLKPGGLLVLVGLYRRAAWPDWATDAWALPLSRVVRLALGEEPVNAPLHDPAETLAEIRAACRSELPGAVVRRRLFYRYTMRWRKPD
jgi:SAM-dependent methyltransferase